MGQRGRLSVVFWTKRALGLENGWLESFALTEGSWGLTTTQTQMLGDVEVRQGPNVRLCSKIAQHRRDEAKIGCLAEQLFSAWKGWNSFLDLAFLGWLRLLGCLLLLWIIWSLELFVTRNLDVFEQILNFHREIHVYFVYQIWTWRLQSVKMIWSLHVLGWFNNSLKGHLLGWFTDGVNLCFDVLVLLKLFFIEKLLFSYIIDQLGEILVLLFYLFNRILLLILKKHFLMKMVFAICLSINRIELVWLNKAIVLFNRLNILLKLIVYLDGLKEVVQLSWEVNVFAWLWLRFGQPDDLDEALNWAVEVLGLTTEFDQFIKYRVPSYHLESFSGLDIAHPLSIVARKLRVHLGEVEEIIPWSASEKLTTSTRYQVTAVFAWLTFIPRSCKNHRTEIERFLASW